jgi:hypothetical protein
VSIRELEERVYEHGDPADLSVLGDALASFGDPRGELIALEAAAGHPLWVGAPLPQHLVAYYDETAEPWRETFLAWAGPALAAMIDAGWVELRFHAGFVDARVRLRADAFAALHDSPVGRTLSSLEIETGSDARELPDMIARWRRKQRWLRRLVLAWWRHDGPPIDLHALAPRLPRLDELSLYGHRVARRIPPGVRTLRLAGAHALELAEPLPSVEHLDLARYPSLTEPAQLAAASRRWFPGLLRLDLSRNEPGREPPWSLGGRAEDGSIFTYLAELDVLPRLRELRLPSLRDADAVSAVRAALARMPAAARVRVARAYENRWCGLVPHGAELADDPRVELPPVFPFPSPEHVGKDALKIERCVVGIQGIIEYLALVWPSLDEPTREAWRVFWRFLDDLPYEDDDGRTPAGELPCTTLLAAVGSCDAMRGRRYRDLRRGGPIYAVRTGTDHLWIELLRALRRQSGGETVTVRRRWGLS